MQKKTTRAKPLALGAALAIGAALAADAQPQYPPYPPYPASPATLAPPSWSYDPYTSGLGPCPQRRPADPPCWQVMPPTYGQPSFWPTR